MEHFSEEHRALAATLIQDVQDQLEKRSEETEFLTEECDGPEGCVGKIMLFSCPSR